MRWLVALAVVTVVPAVAAGEGNTIKVGADFTLTFDGVSTAPQEQAAQFRQQLDSDRDGTVSGTEAAAFEQETVPKMEKAMAEANRRITYLDGTVALDANAEFTFTGLAGPTTSQAPLTSTMHQTIRLQPGPGPQHVLESRALTSKDPDGVPTTVVLTPPPGYWISASTYPGATIAPGGASTTWADGPNVAGAITFTPVGTEAKESPVGPAALVGILAAAGLALRRRSA